MTAGQLRVLLERIRWSQIQVAEELGEPPVRVRKWVTGREAVPEAVAAWFRALASALEAARLSNPPPLVPPGRAVGGRAGQGDATRAA